jgi:hypothetical protein
MILLRLIASLTLTILVVSPATAQLVSSVPEITAFDTPDDAGGSITVTWPPADHVPPATVYRIYLAESSAGPFHLAAEIDAGTSFQSEDTAVFGFAEENANRHFAHVKSYAGDNGESSTDMVTGRPYFVRLVVRSPSGELRGAVTTAVEAEQNYFKWSKLNNFLLGTVFSIIIMLSIALARRRELYIRRIPGLEAMDEALGRATEMGRAVLFIHGLRDMAQIPTIAAVNILSRVARRTADFDAKLRVTNVDPIVMSVSQETVKEAYLEAGRPDAFNPDDVFVVATDQFSYAAAVQGIMLRERPAAHIMMGGFFAEALLFAETGAQTGAIQIAGTDSYTQLPFFITTCDYTLMGEELYAASAYLSREPRLLGSLKGQDIGKAIFLVVLIAGVVLATLDVSFLSQAFTAR